MTILIGDVHGLFYDYKQLIESYGWTETIQLGDFGIGFPDTQNVKLEIFGSHRFIRGNHDNPEVCVNHSNYLGDYGCLNGSYNGGNCSKLFYMSGAWSIDYRWRTPGLDWWPGEQLVQADINNAIKLYKKEFPNIVISHDCPTMILEKFHPRMVIPTRTSQAFDEMLLFHKPQFWIFAHHHISWRQKISGTWFICLDELEYLDIGQKIIQGGNNEIA